MTFLRSEKEAKRLGLLHKMPKDTDKEIDDETI